MSRRNVQRTEPLGGALQTSATRYASWLPSSRCRRICWAAVGKIASCTPAVAQRLRKRATVAALLSNASWIWAYCSNLVHSGLDRLYAACGYGSVHAPALFPSKSCATTPHVLLRSIPPSTSTQGSRFSLFLVDLKNNHVLFN